MCCLGQTLHWVCISDQVNPQARGTEVALRRPFGKEQLGRCGALKIPVLFRKILVTPAVPVGHAGAPVTML